MDLIYKNQRCIFILSVLFCGEFITRYTSCVRYTVGAGRPSLGAKLGLADDFIQKIFLMTLPGDGTVGRGYRNLLETGFKVGENSPSAKIPCRQNFDIK